MKHLVRIGLLLILLAGCVLPSTLPTAGDLIPASSKVVVIGKIELIPPLDAELEQKTHWNMIGDKRILNRVVMATGLSAEPVSTDSIKMRDWTNAIEAEWGVPFMVEAARQRTWFRGAMANLDVMQQDRLWFPGGVYFDVPDGAKAIYIGTLRYTRDDFNTIIDMQIINEFESSAAELGLSANTKDITLSLLNTL